jgi:hypothetical protein
VSASIGTICATSNITSSTVRPRKLKRVNATAARNDISRDNATTATATITLLRKNPPKPETVSTRWKLSRLGAVVHGFGLDDWISPAGLNAESTIQ